MSQSNATPGGMNTLMPNYDPNNPNAQALIGAGGVQNVNLGDDYINSFGSATLSSLFGSNIPDPTDSASTSPTGPTFLGTIQVIFIGGAIILAIWFGKDIFDKVT